MIIPLHESTGRNLNDVRLFNRAVIFRSIREAGLISRAALAKSIGLNPATITHIIRELIEEGLVEDTGSGKSKGGRPGSMLRIRSQAGYVIAIQLDRLYIKGMLTNLNLDEKIQEQVIASVPSQPSDISLEVLISLVRSLLERSNLPKKQILGIGICAPGPLDTARGVLLSPPNFPGWPDTPLRQIVEDKFSLPTYLDQDANACALAEKWFGVMRDYNNFVYILGDGGLGGALFLNGDLYRGRHNIAGEIGHTTIRADGPRCPCGNTGCLELYASAHAVEERTRREVSRSDNSLLVDLVGGNLAQINFQAIVHAAHQGDPLCGRMVREMGISMAAGVVNIVNMLDPEAVVIGGKIALAEDLIRPILDERVPGCSLSGRTAPTPVLFSSLRQDGPITGAFSLVLRQLLQNPFFTNQPKAS